MGASTTKQSRRGRRTRRQNSDINVTPFVDVMLVLLIVFMVVAPMMTVGVPVNLPEKSATEIKTSKQPLIITVQKSGAVFLQKAQLTNRQLIARMKAIYKVNPKVTIFIRGDNNVMYGNVMNVMADLAEIGFKKVSLITKQKN